MEVSKSKLVVMVLCIFFSNLAESNTESIISTLPNSRKPHTARDFSIWVPENFDRNSQNSVLLLINTSCRERLLWFTSKDMYPGQYFEFTMDGLFPDTEYEFIVQLSSTGLSINEYVVFRTEPAPMNEVKGILLVIDEDLSDSELECYYARYAQDLKALDPCSQVEHYYIADDLESKKELYNYLKDAHFDDNIYYIFFIGDNATMPVYTYTLDSAGEVKAEYPYESLSFYTNISNNEYDYDEAEDRFVKKFYSNCPAIYPERQSSAVSKKLV